MIELLIKTKIEETRVAR